MVSEASTIAAAPLQQQDLLQVFAVAFPHVGKPSILQAMTGIDGDIVEDTRSTMTFSNAVVKPVSPSFFMIL